MLFFLVTGISFFFFLNSLSLKPLPPWASDVRLLPLCFWKELSFSPIFKAVKKGIFGVFWEFPYPFPSIMATKQGSFCYKCDKVQENGQLSVLDLPELALDCILEKLSPAGLCSMAAVCSSLRERCISDHLWDRHMKQKWGRILGPAAYREWQWFIASRRNLSVSAGKKSQGYIKFIRHVWPFSWFNSKFDKANNESTSPLVDTVMSWFLALESGKFWFPAQVYNRENDHVGFMLSCYDAELSYDHQTDTFHARYPPHGRRAVAIESGIQWERLRAAPVDTPPHNLHASDCLNDLHPGDHIEIQWRRNKEFPYGWWYGVVGHLESCDGNENYCQCHNSDAIVLEFNQYNPGSRWRRTTVNRKDHREEGNESDGFYGGIRKLYTRNEIANWKCLWPKEILE